MLSTHVTIATELKESKSQKKTTIPFLQELHQFNRKSLSPVTVYYVNRSLPGMYGFKIHGYVVLESKPHSIKLPVLNRKPKLKAKFADVLYLGPASLYAPFYVSDKLIEAVMNDTFFENTTKEFIKKHKGETFLTAEHFFRKLLIEIQDNNEIKESVAQDRNYYLAADPYGERDRLRNKLSEGKFQESERTLLQKDRWLCEELTCLIRYNVNINSEYGVIFPYSRHEHFCNEDRDAFEIGEVVEKAYPNIHVQVIQELWQHQLLYQRFMEEKAGLGLSFDEQRDSLSFTKSQITQQDTQCILNQLTHFRLIFYFGESASNCNRSMATFLQTAENISAQRDKRESEIISSPSLISFGSSLRMRFWQPVQPLTIDDWITKLINNKKLKIVDAKLLQNLADNKAKILEAIERLPEEDQSQVLKRCLDERTQIGQIFWIKRTSCYWQPSVASGFLKQVKIKLEEIAHKAFPSTRKG